MTAFHRTDETGGDTAVVASRAGPAVGDRGGTP